MRWAILMLLVAGCDSGTFARRPGQDEAERIVWTELYGMSGAAPPVFWIYSDTVEGSIDSGGETLPGSMVRVCEGDPKIQDPWPMPISFTSYTHELMHYRTFVRTGDVDAFHERGDWDLADHGAIKALLDAGL